MQVTAVGILRLYLRSQGRVGGVGCGTLGSLGVLGSVYPPNRSRCRGEATREPGRGLAGVGGGSDNLGSDSRDAAPTLSDGAITGVMLRRPITRDPNKTRTNEGPITSVRARSDNLRKRESDNLRPITCQPTSDNFRPITKGRAAHYRTARTSGVG